MEKWIDIKGYEGLYQVSNLGNVKSLDTVKIKKLKQGDVYFILKGKILKIRKSIQNRKSIYGKVALFKNKIRKEYYVHRLVAEHFIGEIKKEYVINHKDFNGLNNNVNNLEIITQKENVVHYHSSNNPHYYNKENLIDMHHNKKMSLRAIAKELNTSHNTIKKLLNYFNIKIIRHSINQYK